MASLNPEFKRKYMSRSLDVYDSLPHGLLTGGFEAKDRPTINKKIGLYADTCSQCGKRFEHTLEHVYRRSDKKGRKIFCSYSCMRAYDLRREDADKQNTSRTGRPRKRREDRIAYYEAMIAQDQAALEASTDRFERRTIKRRMDGRMMALRKIREDVEHEREALRR